MKKFFRFVVPLERLEELQAKMVDVLQDAGWVDGYRPLCRIEATIIHDTTNERVIYTMRRVAGKPAIVRKSVQRSFTKRQKPFPIIAPGGFR